MRIFGVDPGTKKSGWCYLEVDPNFGVTELAFGHDLNRRVVGAGAMFGSKGPDNMVTGYEWVRNYGGVVGEDVFRTAYMCGRVREVCDKYGVFHEPTRPEIIKHFTGRTNLPKPEVRKVLLNRFGGDNAKKKGGPLHGITNHAWDALAVCVYLCEEVYGYGKEDWCPHGL
jgi:hypothetical protein